MIKFVKISLEGFRSHSKFSYKLNSPGLNIITGENGAGKSTIIMGIYWALYGKAMDKPITIEPWEDVRAKSYRGTMASLLIQIGSSKIKIVRCKKYKNEVHPGIKGASGAYLIIDGQIRSDLRDIADVNSEIVKLLGITPRLFKASVVFGQNMKRLISQTNNDQKQVLEELFNTLFISEGRAKAKEKLESLEAEFRDLSNLHERSLDQLKHLKAQRSTKRESIKAFENIKDERIAELTKDLKKLESKRSSRSKSEIKKLLASNESQINKLLDKQLNLKKLAETIFRIGLSKKGVEGTISGIKTQIVSITTSQASKICPECGSLLSKEKIKTRNSRNSEKIKLLEEQLIRYQKELKDYGKTLKSAYGHTNGKEPEKVISKLDAKLEKREKTKNQLNRELELLKLNKGEAKKLNYKLNEAKNLKPPKHNIKKLTLKIKKLNASISKSDRTLNSMKNVIDDHKWVVNVALSNKGLKNYIFNSLVGNLNKHLNAYAKYCGYQVKFFMNMESATKGLSCLVYQSGNERKFEDLSGGQKQMVNVCIAFAMSDILSTVNPCNMLIMDEVFENLSEASIDLISEVIRDKAKKRIIHLITHQSSFNLSNSKITNLS